MKIAHNVDIINIGILNVFLFTNIFNNTKTPITIAGNITILSNYDL